MTDIKIKELLELRILELETAVSNAIAEIGDIQPMSWSEQCVLNKVLDILQASQEIKSLKESNELAN